jgi:hypothetical protein
MALLTPPQQIVKAMYSRMHNQAPQISQREEDDDDNNNDCTLQRAGVRNHQTLIELCQLPFILDQQLPLQSGSFFVVEDRDMKN